MSRQRHVIMQVVKRSGGATHHVEFCIDDNFAERLRQLRSLVPPLTALNKQRDLVQDDQKPAAEAMRDAARQINEEIRKSIEEDPSLRRRSQALIR